ncbi:hypothetical protein [Natronoglycomyces albus]|uniref:Uncharacterized protein n=1 Tax=Natronoglycomyces albus TaxID=2811108 RepID=A0A895XU27_9ACTN|nr:hypothetical protein [Natronoglycomyces albus]QSB06026.1 hypothetical protein JQS30_03630 [Natronoglycomyces albus]
MTTSTSGATVSMRHFATLRPPHPTDVLISADVGPGGEALAIWASTDDAPQLGWLNRHHGTSPQVPMLDEPVLVRLTRHQPNGNVRSLGPMRINVRNPHVQPLPGDRYLVVGARCRYNKGNPDRNATVFSAQGRPLLTATVGDGVQDVQATSSGRLYVSYFDEGVYGSHGWGWPDPPIGSSGLVQFDDQLRPKWQFRSANDAIRIDDCYALNVSGTEVWVYPYDQFPILRLRFGSMSVWTNEVTGAHALITDGTRCALVGGYSLPDRISIGRFRAGRFTLSRTSSITLGERPIPASVLRQAGRGGTLHLITTEGEWWQLRLSDLSE